MAMDKFAQDVVSYVETTGRALGIALTEVKKAEDATKEAAAIVDEVVETLIAHKLIPNEERSQACERLSKHASAVELLARTVEFMNHRHQAEIKQLTAKQASLNQGRPVGDPRPGSASSEDPDEALIRFSTSLQHRLGE